MAHQAVIDGLNFVAVHSQERAPNADLPDSVAIKYLSSKFTKALTNIGVQACSRLLNTRTKKSIVTHIADSGEDS